MRTRIAVGRLITVALVFGLSMGLVDIAISLLPVPAQLSSLNPVLSSLAVTTGFTFTLYLILWFPLAVPLQRWFKMNPLSVALALAFGLATLFTLMLLTDLIPFHFSGNNLMVLCALLLIAILVSIGVYFAQEATANRAHFRKIAVSATLAMPFLLAEAVLLIWLHKYWAGSFFSVLSIAMTVSFVVLMLSTVALSERLLLKRKTGTLFAVLFGFVILGAVGGKLEPAPDFSELGFEPRNHEIRHVILITVDTLRADALSSYGQQRISTPSIDGLAEDGILFQEAISPAPWTLPAIASIMTGLSPKAHQITARQSKVPEEARTLAEYMLEAGYATAAIGRNMFLRSASSISQGFLEYDFCRPDSAYSFGSLVLQQRRLFVLEEGETVDPGRTTDEITHLAIDWLESNFKKDFFLWVHYFDPHQPYAPPADFLPEKNVSSAFDKAFSGFRRIRFGHLVPSRLDRERIRDLYHAEVVYMDNRIGRLLESLKRLNLYDESLILFSSDHGEELWEHGSFEHGHTLYQEVLRIPFIVKLPHSTSKERIGTPVATGEHYADRFGFM